MSNPIRNRLTMTLRLALSFVSIPFFGCAVTPIQPIVNLEVRLVSQDRSWEAAYVIPESSRTTTQISTGREVHVPIGSDVRFLLTSRDYISDFRIPALGLRDFAAPGLPSEFSFRLDRKGRYEVHGDELCGLPHTDKTRGWLVVEEAVAFQAWIRQRTREGN